MTTITIPQKQYDILKKRALLYEIILKSLPERKWAIEDYTAKRLQEFLQEDRLDRKILARLHKLLATEK